MAGVALSVISAISAGNKKTVSSVRDKNNSHGDWRKDFYNGRNGNYRKINGKGYVFRIK